MDESRRLLDQDGDEFERRLLSSFNESPSNEARNKAALAIGLVAATTAKTASATAAAATVKVSVVKTWIALGVVGSVVTTVVVQKWPSTTTDAAPTEINRAIRKKKEISRTPEPAPGPAALLTEIPQTVAPGEMARTTASKASGPGRVRRLQKSERVSLVAEPPSEPAPTSSVVQKPSSLNDSLSAEVSALDRIHSEIDTRQFALAIDLLDQYQTKFPTAVLAPEAFALRVEAVLKQGDRAAAEKLAESFLASHPKSAVAARIRRLFTSPVLPKTKQTLQPTK